MDVREAALQHVDDLSRLVDRERGLRDVCDRRVSWKLERFCVLDGLDEHRRVRGLAHRPDDLFVTGMSDQDDAPSFCRIAPRLHVHLGHERAGGVDRRLPADARRARRRTGQRRGPRARGSLPAERPSRPRQRSRRALRGRGRRARCGRSACGRRRARRRAIALAPPSPRRVLLRRNIPGAMQARRAEPNRRPR